MVIIEPAGRGAIFSAGSINWVSSVLVDEAVSQITRNVLTRFRDETGTRAGPETEH